MIYGNRTECDSGHCLADVKSFRTSRAKNGDLVITCNRCTQRRRGYVPEHRDALHPEDVRRFWSKVRVIDDENSCWEWLAAKNAFGYGSVAVAGLRRPAHRIAYCLETGKPMPEGLEIDHLCRNRACVRPSHLEAVTHVENMARTRKTP